MIGHRVKLTEKGKILEEIDYHKDLNGGMYIDEVSKFHITKENFDDVKFDILEILQSYELWRIYTSFSDIKIKFDSKDNKYIVSMPIYSRYIINNDYLLIFSFNADDFKHSIIAQNFDRRFKELLLHMYNDFTHKHEEVLKELIYYDLIG